jgi:hypothetical protein
MNRIPKPDSRRALELLAGSAKQGCTEAFLLAHGFTVELLGEMVRAGLATARIERARAGGQTRVHITDAGRQALRDKRTPVIHEVLVNRR